MAQEVVPDFGNLPDSCPYTISRLLTPTGEPSATWLIREHDQYGEYPHIYAKLCETVVEPCSMSSHGDTTSTYKVIVLSDSGCGTDKINHERRSSSSSVLGYEYCSGSKENKNEAVSLSQSSSSRSEPSRWNIHTFLLYTLNPGGRIPYIVITSHCHYDHISGIGKLPPTISTSYKAQKSHSLDGLHTTVLTSSLHKSFVTPYANLQKHSLSESVGIQAPKYAITWAEDLTEATWRLRTTPTDSDSEPVTIGTRITLIQTPGHTPDSLSWYDEDLALLFVGDSFYVKESTETRSAPWGAEPPMPTMFDLEGNLTDMWASIEKLLRFVRVKNEELNSGKHQSAATADGQEYMALDGECENGGRRTTSGQTAWYLPLRLWSRSGRKESGLEQFQPRAQSRLPLPVPIPYSHTVNEDDDWVVVDYRRATPTSSHAPPRVRLASAHTTIGIDAEAGILSFREFLARVLRDDLPKKRMPDGFRGEEKWLYDFALDEDETRQQMKEMMHDVDARMEDPLRYLREYSVLAPLEVIEAGRRNISEQEWTVRSKATPMT